MAGKSSVFRSYLILDVRLRVLSLHLSGFAENFYCRFVLFRRLVVFQISCLHAYPGVCARPHLAPYPTCRCASADHRCDIEKKPPAPGVSDCAVSKAHLWVNRPTYRRRLKSIQKKLRAFNVIPRLLGNAIQAGAHNSHRGLSPGIHPIYPYSDGL